MFLQLQSQSIITLGHPCIEEVLGDKFLLPKPGLETPTVVEKESNHNKPILSQELLHFCLSVNE